MYVVPGYNIRVWSNSLLFIIVPMISRCFIVGVFQVTMKLVYGIGYSLAASFYQYAWLFIVSSRCCVDFNCGWTPFGEKQKFFEKVSVWYIHKREKSIEQFLSTPECEISTDTEQYGFSFVLCKYFLHLNGLFAQVHCSKWSEQNKNKSFQLFFDPEADRFEPVFIWPTKRFESRVTNLSIMCKE